ncbi:MAG TPA: hypothetical protein VFU14_00130 [Acidimicrobiales bacterium]|nr:hypothetical protein [Acidimicrobiales bacterium]
MARPDRRSISLLGAVAVVLFAVGLATAGGTPDHHSVGSEIRDAYDNETQHQIAAFLVAVAAVPLLFFAAHLRAVLHDLHPSGRLSADAELAGAVVAAAGLGVQALIHGALAEAAQTAELGDEALQALNSLDGWSSYPVAIGFSTMLIASGIALLRGRELFPPYVAWSAVVLGLLMLVPIVGLVAAPLSGVWVVVISLLLFTRAPALDHLWTSQPDAPRTPVAR